MQKTEQKVPQREPKRTRMVIMQALLKPWPYSLLPETCRTLLAKV